MVRGISMPDRYTAFRLFGEFLWPPMPDEWLNTHPANPQPEPGVVEIHFVRDASNRFVACVRWLPKSRLAVAEDGETLVSDDFTDALSSLPELYDLTEAELLTRLADSDAPFALRVDGPHDAENVRLQFRGAFLLDQFNLDETSNFSRGLRPHPLPDLRLPLLSAYETGGKKFQSELLIGQPDNSNFRFNFAAPLPAPHRRETAERFFAMSALYRPTFQAGAGPDAPARCVDVVFGQGTGNKSGDVPPAFPHLGHFGFCASLSSSSKPFSRIRQATLWPIPTTVEKELLAKLGFDTDLSAKGKPFRIIVGDDDEESLHIRFKRPEQSDPAAYRGSIFFRIGIGWKWKDKSKTGSPTSDLGRDLRLRNGKFRIRVPAGSDEWLECTRRFYVDFELQYTIRPGNIWPEELKSGERGAGQRNRLAVCKGIVRLGFDEPIEASVGAGELSSSTEPRSAASVSSLLDGAIKAMRLAQLDLKHLAPEQPQSFLPDLSVDNPGAKQFALFTEVPATLDRSGHLEWEVREPGRQPGFRLSLGDADQYPWSPTLKTIELTARLTSFHGASGQRSFPIELVHDKAVFAEGDDDRFVMFRVASPDPDEADEQKIRGALGGFRFTQIGLPRLVDDKANEDNYSHLRLGRRAPIEVSAGPGRDRFFRTANLELRLRLAIHDVEPISIDVGRGDRTGRSQPLLFNELSDESEAVGAAPFILDISEEISAGSDWRLTAAILERVQERSNVGRFVVLSEEPFSIYRFFSRPIDARGDQGTIAVASYDSDTRMWELKQVSRLYHYIFPPQSVGESMDKPRRLEIRDVPASDTAGDGGTGFYGPVPPGDRTGLTRRVIEFRLTPSAEIADADNVAHFTFDWFFTGGDQPPHDAISESGLRSMTEAQARIVSVSPRIRIIG